MKRPWLAPIAPAAAILAIFAFVRANMDALGDTFWYVALGRELLGFTRLLDQFPVPARDIGQDDPRMGCERGEILAAAGGFRLGTIGQQGAVYWIDPATSDGSATLRNRIAFWRSLSMSNIRLSSSNVADAPRIPIPISTMA